MPALGLKRLATSITLRDELAVNPSRVVVLVFHHPGFAQKRSGETLFFLLDTGHLEGDRIYAALI